MKKKIAIFGSAIAVFAIIFACNDQLDQPVNGVASIETFYVTDEDAELAIIATYDMLTADNLFDWASPTFIKTLPSDEGTAGGGNSNDQPRYQTLDDFAWGDANQAVEAAWQINYYGIFRANMVVENVEPINDLRKRIIGEAKCLRAYYYMELVKQFGDVPLILRGLTPDEFNQARTPVADIYAQIESDLNDAIAVLPTKADYSAGNKFRASQGLAYALLGKAELFQGNFAEAATAFDNVTGYTLEPNYDDVFNNDNEFGQESLLEASFSENVPYDWNYPWGTRMENNLHVQLMGARAGSTPELDLIAGWGFNYPSEKLWNAFHADDTRRGSTMFSESEYLSYKSTDPNFDGSDWWDYNGYFRLKYGSFSKQTNTDAVPELNYGTNWRLVRYADVLLMSAEAKLQSGNSAGALTDINLVRARAGVPALTAVTLQDIIDERFVELAFEGHRYFDLIRWGSTVANAELSGIEHGDRFDFDKHGLFPIPASEIAASPNLTQNPGY